MSLLKIITHVTLVKFITILMQFLFSAYLSFKFGTSSEFDSFSIALNFIVTLNVGFLIAQSKSFIPLIAKDSQNQELIIGQILRLNIIIFGALSFLIFIFAENIASFLSPGMSFKNHILITQLLKILSTYILFSNLMGIIFGVYEYKGFFVKEMFIELLRQILLFSVAFLWIENFGIIIVGWAHISVLIFVFILSTFLIKLKWKLDSKWFDHTLKSYVFMIIPLFVANSFVWIMETINYMIASYYSTGSVSKINYCQKINNNIAQLFSGLMLVIFPILSRSQNSKDFENQFKIGFHITATVIILLTSFLFVFGEQVVRLLFQQGQFNYSDSQSIGLLLKYYSFAIIAGPIGTFIANSYFASHQHKLAMNITLVSSVSTIIGCLIFSKELGVNGIALATSFGCFAGMLSQLFYLPQVCPNISRLNLIKDILKLFFCSIITIFASSFCLNLFNFNQNLNKVSLALILALFFIFVSIIYFSVLYTIDIQTRSIFARVFTRKSKYDPTKNSNT